MNQDRRARELGRQAEPAPATLAGAPALPRWLMLGSALLAAAALTLALRPADTVFLAPLSEVGYYALAVARNLAAGNGLTIDGSTPTNGFQPLFTFLEAGLFALARGDDILALRFVLVAHWLVLLAAAAVVAAIAGDAGPPAGRELRRSLAAFLYLAAGYLFLHHFNGLETGLLLLLYALAWRCWQRGLARSRAGLAGLGLLLGLAVLARIDAAVLVALLALRELWAGRGADRARALGRAGLLAGTALLVSAPWWLYNWFGFDSLLPLSGQAQQEFAVEGLRMRRIAWALGVGAFPWLYAGRWESLVADLLRLPLFAAGGWLVFRFLAGPASSRPSPRPSPSIGGRGGREFSEPPLPLATAGEGDAESVGEADAESVGEADAESVGEADAESGISVFPSPAKREREGPVAKRWEGEGAAARTRSFARCLAAALVLLALYYCFATFSFWFYARYMAPAGLVGTVALAAALAGPLGSARPRRALPLALLIVPVLVLAAFAWRGVSLYGGVMHWDQVLLVREHVPPGATVAAGQAGSLGFFRGRVVEVDGKVNPDMRQWQGRVEEYLRHRGIEWFVDWRIYVDRALGPDPEARGWRFVARRANFLLYRRDPPPADPG